MNKKVLAVLKQKYENPPERCNCCDRQLNPKTQVFLELDQRTNTYTDTGDVPERYSQGGFVFGAACAKRQIAKHLKARSGK